MRKITLLTTLLLLLTCSAQISAQTIGIKAGPSLTKLFAEDEEGNISDEYDYLFGLHAGIDAVSPVNENLSIKTGAFLTTKGFRYEDSFEDISFEGNAKLLYLDIPITVMLKVPTETALFYGNIGPYLGIGLTGTTKVKTEGGGFSEDETYDIKWGSDEEEDDLRRLDYGLVIGAGADLGTFAIEGAYSYGIANISAYREFDTVLSNRLFTVSVIYKLFQ